MKSGRLHRLGRRVLSMALAAATVLSLVVLEPPKAEALRVQPGQNMTTTTNIVIWDYIKDMQNIASQANVADPNAKYTRVLIYRSDDGERYYFNASPEGGPVGRDPGYWSNYKEEEIYLDEYSKMSNAAHKEWYQDFLTAENTKGSFITKDGLRTPYIQYAGTYGYQYTAALSKPTKTFHNWYMWAANKDDSISDYSVTLVDDKEKMDVRRSAGRFNDPHSYYGADNERIELAKWIFAHEAYVVPASTWSTKTDTVIWCPDVQSLGYDEAFDLDVNPTKFKAWDIDLAASLESFKIFLGAEHAVPTLSQDFVIERDQITTLGRPLFYIPKGKKIVVRSEGILSVDGVLLNDGEIVVEDGGMLILKGGAKIMPFTKNDNGCGTITSYGSVVVQEDSLLCGGGLNGVRIEGGGVVNFGVIAADTVTISQNYAIDNREGGWVLAGYFPKREAWIRWMLDAVADDDVPNLDVNNDFEVRNGMGGGNNILAGSIYGDKTNVKIEGGTKVGNASNPAVSVYTRTDPSATLTPLFEDQLLSSVNMTMDGDQVKFQVGRRSYTVEKCLMSMAMGRGDQERETILRDVWVGPPDEAPEGVKLFTEGLYASAINLGSAVEIVSMEGTDQYLKNSAGLSVVHRNETDADTRRWDFVQMGTDNIDGVMKPYYQIVGLLNGEAIEPQGGGATVNNRVTVNTSNTDSGSPQFWYLIQQADGSYTVALRNESTLVLARQGSNVLLQADQGTEYQRWKLQGVTNLAAEVASATPVETGEDPFDGRVVTLSPRHAPNMRLDIQNQGTDDGTGIVINPELPMESQIWKIERLGTAYRGGQAVPYYRFRSLLADKALDSAAITENGTQSRIWDAGADNINQQWFIEDVGDGYYNLCPRSAPSRNIGCEGNGTSNGTRVVLWDRTGVTNQQWKFNDAFVPVTFGTFMLEMKNNVQKYISVHDIKSERDTSNASILLDSPKEDLAYQQWTFIQMGSDDRGAYYKLINKGSGLALDVSGTQLVQDAWDGYSDQLWYLDESSTDSNDRQCYHLVNRWNTGLVAEAGGGNVNNLASIVLNTERGGDYQQWLLSEYFAPVEMGVFEIGFAASPEKRINYHEDSWAAHASLKYSSTENVTDATGQQWKIVQRGNDLMDGEPRPYFTIQNVKTSRFLDLPTNTAAGSTVLEFDDPNMKSAGWYLDFKDNGEVIFVNRQYPNLAIQAPSTDDGTELQVASYSKTARAARQRWQRWQLHPVMAEKDGSYYIPGNAAAALLGFPNVPAQDLPVLHLGGTYALQPQHDTSKRMDLTGDNLTNGNGVQSYRTHNDANQRWQIVPAGVDYFDGEGRVYYTIRSLASGASIAASLDLYFVLNVTGNGPAASGQDLNIYTYEGNYDDFWYLEPAAAGSGTATSYYLIARGTMSAGAGKQICIEVPGANTADNVQLKTYTLNKGSHQRWALVTPGL